MIIEEDKKEDNKSQISESPLVSPNEKSIEDVSICLKKYLGFWRNSQWWNNHSFFEHRKTNKFKDID